MYAKTIIINKFDKIIACSQKDKDKNKDKKVLRGAIGAQRDHCYIRRTYGQIDKRTDKVTGRDINSRL